ncbi:hypothetical protein ACF07V_06020 [Streptomyces sp. NPDC015661]|uniref:hypothetical protein n=1 Tax=Streptomyces sp. NPDC015661 TaxID=3364961 RepID=UPI0036F60061
MTDDTEWHDSPAVNQEAIDNVPRAAFSPGAHCWWNTQAAGRLPRQLLRLGPTRTKIRTKKLGFF